MTVTGSIGLLAPPGLRTGSSNRLLRRRARRSPKGALQQTLLDAGIEPTLDSNPEKFRRSLAADVALWTPVVKALGLKID
jgi:hypothetical protein